MPLPEMSEEEWAEVFAGFRSLLISHGFAAWDQSMMASLDDTRGDEEEAVHGNRDLIDKYGNEFVTFLKVRSSTNLEDLRRRMGDLVKTNEGGGVQEAIVEPAGDEEAIDILGGPPADELIDEVRAFLDGLAGRGGSDYFDHLGDDEE